MVAKDVKVSLLTVTNRGIKFVALALMQARKQTHKNLELVVVYNYTEERKNDKEVVRTVAWLLREASKGKRDGVNVKPVIIPKEGADKGITLGAMRNKGFDECTGEFIVVWDDDDLYSKTRVEEQVDAILQDQGRWDASTYCSMYVNETDVRGRACNPPRDARRFWIHDRWDMGWEPTLCCKRTKMPRYAHENTGEDTPVLRTLHGKNKIRVIPGPCDYIYMRQGRNAVAPEHEEVWWNTKQATYDVNFMYQLADKFGILPQSCAKLMLHEGSCALPLGPDDDDDDVPVPTVPKSPAPALEILSPKEGETLEGLRAFQLVLKEGDSKVDVDAYEAWWSVDGDIKNETKMNTSKNPSLKTADCEFSPWEKRSKHFELTFRVRMKNTGKSITAMRKIYVK